MKDPTVEGGQVPGGSLTESSRLVIKMIHARKRLLGW